MGSPRRGTAPPDQGEAARDNKTTTLRSYPPAPAAAIRDLEQRAERARIDWSIAVHEGADTAQRRTKREDSFRAKRELDAALRAGGA